MESDFLQALSVFRNSLGHVCTQPNPIYGEDNIHYFDAMALAIGRNVLGYEMASYEAWLVNYMRSCEVVLDGKIVSGLYRRAPDWFQRLISHDEMIGIAFVDRDFAARMDDYGKRMWGCWDNRIPNEWGIWGWQWRFLEAVPYYRHRAGRKLSLWNKICWAAQAMWVTRDEVGWLNGRLKIWMQSHEMRKSESWIIRKACEFYLSKLVRDYGTLDKMMGYYWRADHPFVLWTVGKSF